MSLCHAEFQGVFDSVPCKKLCSKTFIIFFLKMIRAIDNNY